MIVVHYPWRVAFDPDTALADLPTPDDGSISPAVGAFTKWEDGTLQELPGPDLAPGAGQVRHVEGHGNESREFHYSLTAQQYQKYTPESACRKLHYALTDLFIRLSDYLYQYREKEGVPTADRPIPKACDDLEEYLGSSKDFAPESLIVRIARETRTTIKDIVENPRVVLRREHRQVPIDRMQEVDVYSLQDYARRPGRTSAMKAGRGQRLLAVIRNESADTYENRIVRLFVELSERHARQYTAEMCSRCPNRDICATKNPLYEKSCLSERVKTVASFQQFCQMMLNASSFHDVARLAEPKTMPNYVLQQNSRYLNIWKFYLRLLRQENVEADVWVWRRRTFADAARMFMMYFWHARIQKMGSFLMQTSGKPFMIRRENNKGAWLCSDPFEDAAVFKSTDCHVTLYLLNQQWLEKLAGWQDLSRINADFYWVAISSNNVFRRRIMPVWCFCPDISWESGVDEKAEKVCRETKAALDGVSENQVEYKYDLSQSLVLFPGERFMLKAIDNHRFCQVNLFDTQCMGRLFDKLAGWVERLIR